jgi:hypothetical protein
MQMKTYFGAGMTLGTRTTNTEEGAMPPPDDGALAELIAEHCKSGDNQDPAKALRIAHFAADMFVHQVDSLIRQAEMRGDHGFGSEANRLIQLAKTVRKKLTKLHNDLSK